MSRLRVRVELNSRKPGVPLRELVGVVEETRKFFQLLAEDVQIAGGAGDWFASEFDPASLQFTAEYDSPVSPEQIRSFGEAFGGATSLRRETIAQFTRIADFIEEDELVGFGLFQSDQENEPSDWRCLSRRDALRFAEEIHLLAQAAGTAQPAPLPASNGAVQGRRLFKGKQERESLATGASWGLRELEAGFSKRIAALESQVQAHTNRLQALGTTPEAAEEKLRHILTAMESFWKHAPGQLQIAAPQRVDTPSANHPPVNNPPVRRIGPAMLGLTVAGLTLACLGCFAIGLQFGSRSLGQKSVKTVQAASTAAPLPSAPKQDAPKPDAPKQEPLAETVKNQPSLRLIEPQLIHEIALEIPRDLQDTIKSAVRVDVTAALDAVGHVSDVKLISATGADARLVVPEALSAARHLRFQPAKEGENNVRSKVAISFSFTPEPSVY